MMACSRFRRRGASQPDAGLAFVAGAGDVVEIGAARPLQRLPPTVAALRSCAEAPDKSASATAGKRAAKSRSWARSALRTSAPIRTPPSARFSIRSRPGRWRDVDQPARAGNAALHQIQQIGAGGQIGGAGLCGGRDGFAHRRRPDIIELFMRPPFGSPREQSFAPPAPPR